jgi:hypothetical protein
MSQQIDTTIPVMDHGSELAVSFDACVAFHGRTSIGGLALGFRLMQQALRDLAPGRVPERDEIRFRTAFPGPGLRDAVEMVSRAVTRGVYTVDETLAGPEAPEAPRGRLWFEVTVGDKVGVYAARDGALPADFVPVGRGSIAGTLDEAGKARWLELREGLAAAVMAVPADAVLRRL